MNLNNLFYRYLAHTSTRPLAFKVKKAKGIYIYNYKNEPFIDCISGISVSSLGHNNPYINKAIIKQLHQYTHTMVYGEHIQEPQLLLAKNLIKLSNNNFDKVYFTNSGSESVELALKLSLLHTNRKKIIACYYSYHGSTLAACSLKNNGENYKNFTSFKIEFINYNNISDLTKIDAKVACVIIEPIQGEAGYIPAKEEFLHKLREKCNEHNILLIFDEIQTGIGRTGKFFAYEHYNVIPDIIVLAKALGGGLPLGAVLARKNVFETISKIYPLSHLTTFGGNPLSCASANAAINLIVNKYLKSVAKKEKLFKKLLVHPLINKINGKGLMLGIEMANSSIVPKMIKYCYERKILIDWFLFNNKSIRIAPPLIISENEIKMICKEIIKGLNSV